MIYPVILCGGSGTRLWPLSRKSYPKQFAKLLEEQTLFQASVSRLAAPGYGAPVVVTASDFRFIVTEQLADIDVEPKSILIEPEGRNTAAAILAAAFHIAKSDPDAVMLVAPSDHVIPDDKAFRKAVEAGKEAVVNGQIVTFGILPDRPETGYGYLQTDGRPEDGTVQPLIKFVEKPDQSRAEKMLKQGNFLWNAGIFLFAVRDILDAFAQHAPNLIPPVEMAVENAKKDLGFLRLDPASWARVESISIDYAVMEQASNLSVVPFNSKWSDLGDWNAIWGELDQDPLGTVTTGNATSIDCKGSLLRSEAPGLELVGLGLEDLVVVAMPDAVLVANRADSQSVKQAVDHMKAKKATQAEQFPRDHRPWGWFESLVVGDRFQVKRIVVKPGGELSLQSHMHRAEHWIVVEGTAKVTVDDEVKLVSENQSVYIPLGAIHRMENPGKVPMVLIEVQTGAYLGEDDITRYEDKYARSDE